MEMVSNIDCGKHNAIHDFYGCCCYFVINAFCYDAILTGNQPSSSITAINRFTDLKDPSDSTEPINVLLLLVITCIFPILLFTIKYLFRFYSNLLACPFVGCLSKCIFWHPE